jgi:hypothetical protein
MTKDKRLPTKSSGAKIAAFLDELASAPVVKPAGQRGRLIFALDATASRQPTWDRATHIQGQMFTETASLGGLEIQLCFYRGYGEFNYSPWYGRSQDLLKRMTAVFCLGGLTQIRKVLQHAIKETKKQKVQALVFVGDCVEEDVDQLSQIAGEMGLLGVPAFLFHEGHDRRAAQAFEQVARLSNGACCPFDADSPKQLKELLSAVAVYAAGGHRALEHFSKDKAGPIRRLVHQIGKRN